MKKLVLFIFVLLLGCFNPLYARNIRFIQVTDVHIKHKKVEELQEFVANINRYPNIDFVIFTGDNIDKPDIEDLNAFLDAIKDIKIKTYVLMGNHDVAKYEGLDKKLYMHTVRAKLGYYHPAKPNYVFRVKGVVFVVMDGVKEVIPSANGYYKNKELVWLDKVLSSHSSEKVVIFQHFPLLNTTVKSHSLYKKEEYVKVLNKYLNVIAVISGHYHSNIERMEDGVYQIVTPSFQHNGSYKLIDIDTDSGAVYTIILDDK